MESLKRLKCRTTFAVTSRVDVFLRCTANNNLQQKAEEGDGRDNDRGAVNELDSCETLHRAENTVTAFGTYGTRIVELSGC